MTFLFLSGRVVSRPAGDDSLVTRPPNDSFSSPAGKPADFKFLPIWFGADPMFAVLSTPSWPYALNPQQPMLVLLSRAHAWWAPATTDDANPPAM